MVVDAAPLRCAPVGPSFVQTRAFPPAALKNVPLPYILDQLYNLAVHYWDKPETADCTIIVPIQPPHLTRLPPRNSPTCTSNDQLLTPPSEAAELPPIPSNQAGLPRRETEPKLSVSRVTRMTSKLHLDYLLAQSSLFRALFSGRSPLDHLSPSSPDSPTTPPLFPEHAHHSVPPNRMPRILPSTSSHPTILLPLPHPESFPHLMHFMYFGTTRALEEALNKRQFPWEDVVRNVEYLGMRTRIKVFLGRWYASWQRSRLDGRPPVVCEDAEDDPMSMSGDDDEDDSEEDEDETDSEGDYDSDYDTEEGEEDNLMSDSEQVNMRMAYTLRCLDKSKEYSPFTLEEPPRGRSQSQLQQHNNPSPVTSSPSRL